MGGFDNTLETMIKIIFWRFKGVENENKLKLNVLLISIDQPEVQNLT